MKLVNIERAFNAIWRSPAAPGHLQLLLYWAGLSLGPLLLGAALSSAPYLPSLNFERDAACRGSYRLGCWAAVPCADMPAFTLVLRCECRNTRVPFATWVGGGVAFLSLLVLKGCQGQTLHPYVAALSG